MMWKRVPRIDFFASDILEYQDPHLLLLWSSWDGAWALGVDKGNLVMDDDNLRLWLSIDIAWLRGDE